MKTIFIGIDISKDTLDVAIQETPEEKPVDEFQVENNVAGIKQLVNRVKKRKASSWYCFEHTGNYGYLLCDRLSLLKQTYSVVPAIEIQRSLGLVRGKTDSIDAGRIANYACTHQYKLKAFKLQSDNLREIKEILTFRNQKSRILRQYKNSLHSHKITGKTVKNDFIIKDIKKNIALLSKDIKELEAKIAVLIKDDKSLSKTFKRICTIVGVGPIIATYMIVITDNFKSFDNPRKFNCYAGLAPFEYKSGSSIRGRTKTSKYRNKTIKTLLHNGVTAAINHDPEIKAYFKRKTKEGKHKRLIKNNIACKLVSRMFAVAERDEPYVKLVR